jgi:hypothetical protein
VLLLAALPAALPAVTFGEPRLLPRVPGILNEASGFGRSISVSGDWMAVGAPDMDDPSGPVGWGGVYLYRRARSGSWLLQTTLFYPRAEIASKFPNFANPGLGLSPQRFGYSVALSGTFLVVGVPRWAPAYGEFSTYPNMPGSRFYRGDRGGAFFYRRTGARTWELEHVETLREEHDTYQ